MRPVSHFGSFVAALALGLALAAAGGAAFMASAPTIPARDVIKAPVRAHATASTLSAWAVPDFGNPDGHALVPPAGRAVATSHRMEREPGTSRDSGRRQRRRDLHRR
jgi:hypothetical protein